MLKQTFCANEFSSPAAAWRGKPLWVWNGRLERDELIRQIQILKDMGMGGFFVNSRVGLATDYLGEEWFALVNACTEAAAACGLESWLYDEDKWPSGTAAGMVTAHPEYRMKFIYLETFEGNTFDFDSWMQGATLPLGCWSCDCRNGIDIFDVKTIDASTPRDIYRDQTILTFRVATNQSGGAYADTLKREATEEFFRLTHERYKEHCGKYFGKEIKGIFTDEPHRGPMLSGFGGHVEGLDSMSLIPWTERLFDVFEERYGYRVEAHLPELFLRKDGHEVSGIKHQYNALLLDLFLENYAKPYYDWCQENRLMATGHVLHENSLACQVSNIGSVQAYYPYMHIPGIDYLGEHGRHYWVAKQIDSVARQYDRPWVLSELYGLSGWHMNFESHKAVGAWQALFGVNLRCHHLSWYNMAGASKRDYPASILHQSPWYKEYNFVETWFSRFGYFRSQGVPCCDLLVLNPVESLWGRVYPGAIRGMRAMDAKMADLEKQYTELFHILAGNQIDFDYGDEGLLKDKGAVETTGGPALLRLGCMTYTTVLVAGMDTMRASTLDLLERFADAGGSVIFAGAPPAYVDANRSDRVESFAAAGTSVAFREKDVVSVLEGHTPTRVKIMDAATGQTATDIFCQLRCDEESHYLMILNSNREEGYALHISLGGVDASVVEEWNLDSGERGRMESSISDGLRLACRLAPSGARCFRLVKARSLSPVPLPATFDDEVWEPDGDVDFEMEDPNICVLDLAEWSVGHNAFEPAEDILEIDRQVRERFGVPLREGNPVQPWVRAKKPLPVLGCVRLKYTFDIEQDCLGTLRDMALVMETPEWFNVRINDMNVPTDCDDGFWCDIALRKISLQPDIFKLGTNTIILETAFREHLNLEAIYLLGCFAVRMKGIVPVLGALPRNVSLTDLVSQGFPFYSGAFRYIFQTPEALVGKICRVTLPAFEGAYAKVRSGNTERLIPWRPHEAILRLEETFVVEVSITRKNTFGPLHDKNPRPRITHPGSFMAGNQNYCKEPVFLASGLFGNLQLAAAIPASSNP